MDWCNKILRELFDTRTLSILRNTMDRDLFIDWLNQNGVELLERNL